MVVQHVLQLWWVVYLYFVITMQLHLLLSQIGSNFFITAAHCLQDIEGVSPEPSEVKIFLGLQNREEMTKHQTRFPFSLILKTG